MMFIKFNDTLINIKAIRAIYHRPISKSQYSSNDYYEQKGFKFVIKITGDTERNEYFKTEEEMLSRFQELESKLVGPQYVYT